MADIPRWGIPLVSIYTVTFIPRKRAVAEIVLVVLFVLLITAKQIQ
ncbi:hypothetical protein HZB03_05495 [Candidatus Woesearchaeota archaeon]|nr:hypothetical protein [Candidatus Woesearchaeota archaeon]